MKTWVAEDTQNLGTHFASPHLPAHHFGLYLFTGLYLCT